MTGGLFIGLRISIISVGIPRLEVGDQPRIVLDVIVGKIIQAT